MEKAVIKVSLNGPKCRPKILRFLIDHVIKRMVPHEVIWNIGNKSTSKGRKKAMEIAATSPGVLSIAVHGAEMDQLVVTGERLDPVRLTRVLSKEVGFASIESFGPNKK